MKKRWIFMITLILSVVIVGAGAFAYQSVRSPLDEQLIQAEKYAMKEGLQSISHVEYYYGTTAYYIIQGTSQDASDIIMWIKDDFSAHFTERKDDGITPDEALSIVEKDVNIKSVQSIRLGYERGMPIYEVTYKNNENQQGYYYVTFANGTFMKRYQLRTD